MSNDTTPLRRLRLAKKMTLQDVCAKVPGLDTGNLSRIERGKQKATTDVAEALAKLWDGELTELEILYPNRYPAPAA